MNALIRWSIRYRGFVALLSVVWLIAGSFLAMRAPLDVFPEFVPPQVTIQTETPASRPSRSSRSSPRPIEAAIIGGPGIDTVRSEVDLWPLGGARNVRGRCRRECRAAGHRRTADHTERKASGWDRPPETDASDVEHHGRPETRNRVRSGRSLHASGYADWTIKPRLLAVPGIARVTVYGGAIRQVQVQPDLERLSALGLTITDVMNAVSGAIALRGGGVVETSAQRITIETPPPSPEPQTISGSRRHDAEQSAGASRRCRERDNSTSPQDRGCNDHGPTGRP